MPSPSLSPPPTRNADRLVWLGRLIMEWPWNLVERLGGGVVSRIQSLASILALLWATISLSLTRSSWTPTVRAVLSRQILFTLVDAIPATIRFATVVGVLLIVQAAMWIDTLGASTELIAPVLWRAIVREIAPLLACLVVIGRSGIAISTELASMHASDEIEILDSQGIDPMTFLVMPRIIAVILSVFCLAIVIAVTMVITGYAVGLAVDSIRVPWSEFLQQIARNFNGEDLVFFSSKTLIAGAFCGAICCIDGMSVRGAMTDVPRVTSRAGIHALTAVFAVSAILSILFYGRLLVFQIG